VPHVGEFSVFIRSIARPFRPAYLRACAELVERAGSLQESHNIEWPILNLGMLFPAKCNIRINPPCNGLIRLSSIRLGV
jgi:hypothetical protein